MRGSCAVVLTVAFAYVGVAAGQFCESMVWPLPQSMNVGSMPISLAPKASFQFTASQQDDILNAAFVRYTDIIFGSSESEPSMGKADSGALTSVVVTFQSTSKDVPLQVSLSVGAFVPRAVPTP
jgi:hypothetical protein